MKLHIEGRETYAKIWNGKTIGPGDVLNASIGQGNNNFTPMQIAKYISSIANGGTVIDPTIIKSVLNSDGTEQPREEIESYTNEKLGLQETDDGIAINPESIAIAKEGMLMAASEAGGTAYNVFKNYDGNGMHYGFGVYGALFGGIAAAVFFGYIASLISKPKIKNKRFPVCFIWSR